MQKRHACLSTKAKNYLITEPQTFTQAKPYAEWCDAMQSEINVLLQNHTWVLVSRPPVANIIGSKWVYQTKRKANREIDRFKARLVAKGYSQQPSIDYTKTFNLVVKATTIRTILSIATSSNWPIRQLDISNEFLHGFIDSNIYMEQPIGFQDSSHLDYVCKLSKLLYGLK